MTTATDVASYRRAVDDLTTLALSDFYGLLASLDGLSGEATRNGLIAALPEVMDPYITSTGEISAAWYEELRAQAVGGTYYASTPATVNPQQVEALVRWGVKPLFELSDATVLSLIGGGLQKIIAGAGRDTIETNVMQDPVRVGYSRIPRPNCCAFCGLVASRGAAYTSAESAGIRSKFHDFCRCVVAPVFEGDTFHKDVEKQFLDKYLETAVSTPSGSVSTKGSLAAWRKEFGTR